MTAARLTLQEQAFLDALWKRAGQVVTLADLQWALHPDGETRQPGIFKVLACRVRAKIAGSEQRIDTVHGQGYRLVPAPEREGA